MLRREGANRERSANAMSEATSEAVMEPKPNGIPTAKELGFDPAALREKYAAERSAAGSKPSSLAVGIPFGFGSITASLVASLIALALLSRLAPSRRSMSGPSHHIGLRCRAVKASWPIIAPGTSFLSPVAAPASTAGPVLAAAAGSAELEELAGASREVSLEA